MREPSDQAQRLQIRGELDRCVWVEAGAGSGKTTELVNRLINLILVKGVPLREIVAITFTRKAATELKTRVQDEIERAFLSAQDPVEKTALESALANIGDLFAETIHSFCMQLLQERPLEAGLPPDFTIMEKSEDARLRASVLHRCLDALRREDQSSWEELLASGLGPTELEQAFRTLCDHADVDFPAGDAPRPDYKGLAEELRGLVAALDGLVGGPDCFDIKEHKLYDQYVRLKALLELEKKPRPAIVREAVEIFANKATVSPKARSMKGWRSSDMRLQAEIRADSFQQSIAAPEITRWRAYLYRRVIEVLSPAREEVLSERKRVGRVVQEDLLRLTARLLRGHPDVRRMLSARYRYIFVDEFQDTDPIQAEIMLLLAGDDPNPDWTRQSPRPGALFVVGDPKQSIYRFRRADIATYQQTKAILMVAGAVDAPLTTSFRSQPKVCAWVNDVFRGVLPAVGDMRQAGFAELRPMRLEPSGYDAGVYALDISIEGTRKKGAKIAAAEADSIARFIKEACDSQKPVESGKGDEFVLRPARPGDFLVIARSKKYLALYTEALDRLKIPNEVVATDRGGVWEGLGVFTTLLRAVTDPDDELAIVSCLRGPLFGLTDDELYQHRAGGGSFRLTLAEEDARPVGRALFLMRECWQLGRTKPAGLALSFILEKTGLLAMVRARDDGPARAGDILAAVSFVRSRSLAGETVAEALDSLEREFEDNKGDSIGRPPLAHGGDRVRIMNLHKAKGLEARFVFLVEPMMKTDHEPSLYIRRQGGTAAKGYFAMTMKYGSYGTRIVAAPESWEACQQEATAFEAAEKDRLQYVATTRARDFLILTRYAGNINANMQIFGPLMRHLGALPPLLFPESQPAAVSPATVLGPAEYRAAFQARHQARAAALPATYSVQGVTDRVKELEFDAQAADWGHADGPRGMEWGDLIHRALEVLVRSGQKPSAEELERLVVCLGGKGSSLARHADKAVPLLQNALNSDLWSRMLASSERHAEVPFQGLDGTTVVSGAIDLIFRGENGWELVDFKTDAVGSDTSVWVDHYRPQLEEYAKWWTTLTGEQVSRRWLLFARTGAVALIL